MTLKEQMVEAVGMLPDDAQIEDAMEKLLFLAKIENGIEQANQGNTISHEDVKTRLSRWLN